MHRSARSSASALVTVALVAAAVLVPSAAVAAEPTGAAAPTVTAPDPVGYISTAKVVDADATRVTAIDPASHRAFVQERHGTMPTSHVAVFDGDTMRRIGAVAGMENETGLRALVVDTVHHTLAGVTDHHVVVADLVTGALVWRTPVTVTGWDTGLVFDAPRGRFLIGSTAGVSALDAATGKVLWWSAPTGVTDVSAAIDVDSTNGTVYLATDRPGDPNGWRPKGKVWWFDASGAALGTAEFADTRGIAVDGPRDRIYVGLQAYDRQFDPVPGLRQNDDPTEVLGVAWVDAGTGTVWYRASYGAGTFLWSWSPSTGVLGTSSAPYVSAAGYDPVRDRFIGMTDTTGIVDSSQWETWVTRYEHATLSGTTEDVIALGVPRREAPLTVNVSTWNNDPPVFDRTVTAGAIPPGMQLDRATGVLSGTPNVPGTFRYAVTATLNNLATSVVFVRHVVAVDRLAGPNRFATTAAASKRAYPDGARVVYIASGKVFPDALSAAPAAAVDGGPVLLSEPDSLPADTRAELARLRPQRVVVVGGSVGPDAVAQVRATLPGIPVSLVSGRDRYEVSRAVVQRLFAGGAPSVYVATGAKFPDALVAGAAAGSAKVPLLLVRGDGATADAATLATLRALHPAKIVVAGGSVSPGIVQALRTVAPVDQQSGPDRYQAAAAVDRARYATADQAFLVTGADFPDALSASPLAAVTSAPLYLAQPGCVPSAVLDALAAQGVSRVTIVGGQLGSGPAALRRC